MVKLFSRFFDNRSGATAIQFGFIAVGIVIVMIAVVSEFEPKLNTTFSTIASASWLAEAPP